MICKKCGKEIDDNSTFCPLCGVSVEVNEEPKPDAEKTEISCKYCGEKVLANAKKCKHCHSILKENVFKNILRVLSIILIIWMFIEICNDMTNVSNAETYIQAPYFVQQAIFHTLCGIFGALVILILKK